MKISPQWLRDFVAWPGDDRQLAADLTMAGLGVEGTSGEGASSIFEVEVTTNRVDAMNHYGIAREVSAIYDVDLKPLVAELPAAAGPVAFPVSIEDAQGCARFSGRVIRGVKIGPSPKWVADRLSIEGHRAINSAADATNYNLMEMGHPTHAYDLDLLEAGRLIVRRARKGEKIKTLDGVERALLEEDLVIADAVKPVGIAGVMGGWDSMISESTRNILVEAAWFDPASVRRTARRLGMHTDASHRFERGADWGATLLAAERVAGLILKHAGGQLDGPAVDIVARDLRKAPIELRATEVRRILGQELSDAEIVRILRRLGFEVTAKRASAVSTGAAIPKAVVESADAFSVKIPTWRMDVAAEIDLIEELARIHGYNRFENHLPSFSSGVVELPDAPKEQKVRTTLLALGYNEAISLTFQSATDAETFSRSRRPVPLENALNDEAPLLRNSLASGMLDMLGWNLNRGSNDVKLFEAGHVFALDGDKVLESNALCLGATGLAALPSPFAKAQPYDFYTLKGDVEALLSPFAGDASFVPLKESGPGHGYYHPGRSASILLDGKVTGMLGQLHPAVAEARKLKQECYLAEISLEKLFARGLREPRYEPLSRYPAVERDFSLLLDDGITWERLRQAIVALKVPEMTAMAPADFYAGKNLPAGKHSMLLRVTFQSGERTLRDEEVATWSEQIVKAVEALGGSLRG